IDFSTANAAPAPGHAADAGLPFDATRGFGWSQAVATVQRDMLPNDCRDSFAQVVNNTTATWEMVLPNGDYRVSLTCGDPFGAGPHRVALEGQVVVQDVFATSGVFVTRSEVPVSVRDGRLTVTLGGSGATTATKLDCVEVRFGGVSRRPRNNHQITASDRPM